MIQIDGIRRQVFIKLINDECVNRYSAQLVVSQKKHQNEELSTVAIAVAGLGTKGVRVANLPPDVNDAVLMTSLAPFGKVTAIKDEMWAKSYRYAVAYGTRQMTNMMTRHIPSHLTVAGSEYYYHMAASRPPAMDVGRQDTFSRHAPSEAQSTRGNTHPTRVVCGNRGTDRLVPRASHDKRGAGRKTDNRR